MRIRAALIGGLILVLGISASCFLAAEWRSGVRSADRKSFDSTATDLGNALDAELNGDIALMRAMRARATMGVLLDETSFLDWYRELQRGAPSTPNVTATFIQLIPASALAAFRRETEADPAFRVLLGGSFRIVPSGRRPVYCLTRAIVGQVSATSLHAGLLDYCAPTRAGSGRPSYASLIQTTTDTGSFIVTPLSAVRTGSVVAIGAAVYRRDAPLTTVRERAAALSGFIGTTFDSAELIRSLVGRRPMTLALYHRNVGGPLQLVGRVGGRSSASSPRESERLDLGEGWLLEASGTASHSVSANAQALLGLAVGLIVTILAFALHRALSRSRQQAWGLVGEKTEELAYRALHDPLTDLPNRGLVVDRAEQLLARARRMDVPVTALVMDIDGLKQINDRFGHEAGDQVLRQVGARLNAVLRGSDTVGRVGGDEFAMVVDSVGLDAAPELVAERILDVLRQPIDLSGQAHPQIAITASIGVATGLSASAEELLQDADLALYKAKAAGKNGHASFSSAMQSAARDRIHLDMDLADALGARQFFLVYQPILDLTTRQVVGVEALLRWRHPTRGIVAPDVFIPIAEENGLIVPIGRWVLRQACAQGARWSRNGHRLGISVNVSGRQLERAEILDEVRTALDDSGLDPAALTLEITETVLMKQPEATACLLAELKKLDVRIAVDDFGTGYSSLAYLRQFPVDSLKIDRTFIDGLALSDEADALTHTLIQLGKALSLQTLAEGVEHESQVQHLQGEGCDLVQGFLFARPLSPTDLEGFLTYIGRTEAISAAI